MSVSLGRTDTIVISGCQIMNRLIILLFSFFIPMTNAEQLPLWELGVGVGSYMAPHYFGSDQTNTYTIPVPYAVYRGEYIRSDRGGLRGRIYESEKLDLRVSLGASLPVSNDDNRAREGMPDLDLMLEAGPTLQYQLFKDESQLLRFDFPVRAAFTVGDDTRFRGGVSSPRLYYQIRPDHWKLTATLGVVYATEKYHAYYYDVESRYATEERPEYIAEAGYTGLRSSFSVSKRFGPVFLGSFINYYDIRGAENEESPLVKKKDYLAVAFALSYVFAESKQRVNGTD